jgi:YHS domain-containing protein
MRFLQPMERNTMNLVRLLPIAGTLLASSVLAAGLHAGGEFNSTYANLGIKGYDPVAYFTVGKAVRGSEKYTVDHGGVTWRFWSAESRDAFRADPAKYAPQYGGFCTWGVAEKGRLFDVDPENGWTIHEGKLYLNFNADINKIFQKDPVGFVRQANARWPQLSK